jgi:hypothetical protein
LPAWANKIALQDGETLTGEAPYVAPVPRIALGLALVPVLLIPLAAICAKPLGPFVSAGLFTTLGIGAWVGCAMQLKPKQGLGLLLTSRRAIMILKESTLEARGSDSD